MKKKIISKNQFNNKKKSWIENFSKNKTLKKISKKLYVEADKHNYSYFFSWQGETILQTPEDIITLQEIISELKPEVIIEVGVAWGGTMLFYDSLSKQNNIKKIIGIDIYMPDHLKKSIYSKAKNNNIYLYEEDSTNPKLLQQLKKKIKNNKGILIQLDSNHTKEHVLKELDIFSKLCKKNDVIIVGDTIIEYIPKQTHRVREWEKGNNPKNALDIFLKKNKTFKIDKKICAKQMFTNNPKGYIRKI
jgi:cephalosporin hydroxylase